MSASRRYLHDLVCGQSALVPGTLARRLEVPPRGRSHQVLQKHSVAQGAIISWRRREHESGVAAAGAIQGRIRPPPAAGHAVGADPPRPTSRASCSHVSSQWLEWLRSVRLVEWWMGQAAPAKPFPPPLSSVPLSRWGPRGALHVHAPKQKRSREWAGRFALTPDPLLEMSRQMGEGVNGCERSEWARPAGLDTQSRTKQTDAEMHKIRPRRPYNERLADGRPAFGTLFWDSVRQRPCPP